MSYETRGHRYHVAAIALALAAMSCAPSHDLSFPPESRGDVEPVRSATLGSGIARVQTFVAESEGFYVLQILVARDEVRDDIPVRVEVRSPELDRRYGVGRIEPFDGEPYVPEWRAVRWSEEPEMKPDEKYALVLTTDEYTGSWVLPVAESSTYPLGDMLLGFARRNDPVTGDMGFRGWFDDGSLLRSEMVSSGRVRSPAPHEPPSPYGDIVHLASDKPFLPETVLPVCLDDHCADLTQNLAGTPVERAELAAESFALCHDSTIDVLEMARPTIGLSCRDVCRGKGYPGCVTSRKSRSCEPAGARRHPQTMSCDTVVSSVGDPDEVYCLCAEVEVHHQALVDEEAIETMVRKNYRLQSDGDVALRKNAVPSGVTCAQICCELAGTMCGKMTRKVTPLQPLCGTCRVEPNPAFALKTSAVAAGKFVTRHDSKVWLIDPEKARIVASFDSIPEDLRAQAAGHYFYWREPGRKQRTMWVLDVDKAQVQTFELPRRVHTRECEPTGSDDHLVNACYRTRLYTLERLIPPGDVLVSADIPRGEPKSFDGKTLVVETSGGDWRWTVGEEQSQPALIPSDLRPRWATALILDRIFEIAPDYEGFAGDTFYAGDNDGLWSYTPATKEFRRWPRTEDRARLLRLEDDLVRIRGHVLDPTTRELKRLDFEVELWIGRRAIVRTTACPASMSCTELPAPFTGFSVLEVDPTKLSDYRAIKPSDVPISPP